MIPFISSRHLSILHRFFRPKSKQKCCTLNFSSRSFRLFLQFEYIWHSPLLLDLFVGSKAWPTVPTRNDKFSSQVAKVLSAVIVWSNWSKRVTNRSSSIIIRIRPVVRRPWLRIRFPIVLFRFRMPSTSGEDRRLSDHELQSRLFRFTQFTWCV